MDKNLKFDNKSPLNLSFNDSLFLINYGNEYSKKEETSDLFFFPHYGTYNEICCTHSSVLWKRLSTPFSLYTSVFVSPIYFDNK